MSDQTPPRFVWLDMGGRLSHHRPADPTAVEYVRADVMRDEVERLQARERELEAQVHGLAEALAEVKATVDGDSTQPVRDIVYGYLWEQRNALAAVSAETEGREA